MVFVLLLVIAGVLGYQLVKDWSRKESKKDDLDKFLRRVEELGAGDLVDGVGDMRRNRFDWTSWFDRLQNVVDDDERRRELLLKIFDRQLPRMLSERSVRVRLGVLFLGHGYRLVRNRLEDVDLTETELHEVQRLPAAAAGGKK